MRRFAIALFFLILTAPLARDVTFTFTPNISADRVNLAGSFNGWSTDETPMKDEDGDNTWEVSLDLLDGEYQYKFVVNGDTWLADPNNPKTAPDGYGGQNSVITVGDWEKFSEKSLRGDGKIMTTAFVHRSELPYLCDDGRGKIWVRVRVKGEDIDAVSLLAAADSRVDTVPMPWLAAESPFEFFEASIPSGVYSEYSFLLRDGNRMELLPEDEKYRLEPEETPVFVTPEWAAGALFYQIFPERFANGEGSPVTVKRMATAPRPA